MTIGVLSKRRQQRVQLLEHEVERLEHIIAALNSQVIQESLEIQRLKGELEFMNTLEIEEDKWQLRWTGVSPSL